MTITDLDLREPGVTPFVEQGVVHLFFAYDVGPSIDLAAARRQITGLTELAHIKHKGHAPTYFQFDPPPLRVIQEVGAIAVSKYKSDPTADVVIYDFGGLSVSYSIPFRGTFDELIELSIELSSSRVFRDDSRQRIAHLMAVIESAVERPEIEETFEDYTVFEIGSFRGGIAAEEIHGRLAPRVARLLRSEADPLSEQEVTDALASRVSFGVSDVAVIDWSAALLCDREPEDVLSVLEFANLQLLEMRFLDGALDRALDRAYELISRSRPWFMLLPGTARKELRRVGRMQVDAAILFERVGNALKLLGDQYLARVYRSANQRYRIAEWNAGVLRKLETLESIYEKVHDQSSSLRMEALEWIIIALIAIEILMPLFERLFSAVSSTS